MSDPTPATCCAPRNQRPSIEAPAPPAPPVSGSGPAPEGTTLVELPAATFMMGDAFDEGYPHDGETPVHAVHLPAYAVSPTAVSNAEFAAFVDATGHRTAAEVFGVSAVFHLAVSAPEGDVLGRVGTTPWWLAVRGADWRRPEGRSSDLDGLEDHPVVHVSWDDAVAYCSWAGVRLPSEAEWERAARGGLDGARFAWGDELMADGAWRCNIWQGTFPDANTAEDGHLTTAPVDSFEPNGFGLFNTGGNVWEWCADWFSAGWYADSPTLDPRGPAVGSERVMRGGSFLCHESYCHRYRVAARSSNTPDASAANIGFRVAADRPSPV